MENTIEYSLDEIKEAAYKLMRLCADCKIWLFEGEMAAGKTTLIKQICKNLGVKDVVTSPTFSLVNEYATSDSETIYHFDFYRIKHETEALDIGADEYFYSNNLCLIEWPSKIPSLVPKNHAEINIMHTGDNKRKIFVRIFNE